MTEIWIPYGAVETLVTVQAENLGSVVQPEPEKGAVDFSGTADALKTASALFLCDSSPPTVDVLRGLSQAIASAPSLKIMAAAPKTMETAVPELKGRFTTLPPPIRQPEGGPAYSSEVVGQGRKVFIGTGRPDPLFGIVDAKIGACLNWVAGSASEAASARKDMEPAPFAKTRSYDRAEELASKIADAEYMTVVPRGGRAFHVSHDEPFDAMRGSFLEAQAPRGKGLVLGAGGTGYDDTLSSAIRCVWSAVPALRPSGELLLIAECSGGLGSPALEMLATGRMSDDAARRSGRTVIGIEEVAYLEKLKEEYDLLMLTGLPEVYAKSRLGISTARGSGEAVGRLLNKVGRSGKVNVVTRSGECRVQAS